MPWEELQVGKGGTRGQRGRGTPIFMSACLGGGTVGGGEEEEGRGNSTRFDGFSVG